MKIIRVWFYILIGLIIFIFFKMGGCENNLERIVLMNAFLFSVGVSIVFGMVQYLFTQKDDHFPDDFREIFITSGWIYEIVLIGGGLAILGYKNVLFL